MACAILDDVKILIPTDDSARGTIPVLISRFASLFGMAHAATLQHRFTPLTTTLDTFQDSYRIANLIAQTARSQFSLNGCGTKDMVPSIDILQIGAHVGNSTNDPLYKWLNLEASSETKAVLVEPVPSTFIELQQNYRFAKAQVFFENAAVVTSRDLELAGPESSGPPLAVMHATANSNPKLDPKFAGFDLRQLTSLSIEQVREFGFGSREILVPALDWKSLLGRHKDGAFVAVGTLIIDAEGLDCELLLDYPWGFGRPQVIIFEHKHCDGMNNRSANAHWTIDTKTGEIKGPPRPKFQRVLYVLRAYGYLVHSTDDEDIVFYLPSDAALADATDMKSKSQRPEQKRVRRAFDSK